MKIGIVGGGVLGLTLGYRLSGFGHQVEIFEAAPDLGGLAAAHDYGPFVWDRFYHCILPTDTNLIELLGDLGLGGDLRWTQTGTGYYANGINYPMNNTVDQLRLPLLSWMDKARLGATVIYATRFADPWQLYTISAENWLLRLCGRRSYEVFWRPLLKAKFGTYYDKVAAVFIWATLTRLFSARSAATSKEKLGYCRGGYRRILDRMAEVLRERGAAIHVDTAVVGVGKQGQGCEIAFERRANREHTRPQTETFDQVIFTAPTRLARKLASSELMPLIERVEYDHPTSSHYLGVLCLVLALKRPLTPFYVLNIGDERIELTGLIEMTNLIDRDAETSGLSLVYVPRYVDSADPLLDQPEEALRTAMIERGVKRLFPDLDDSDVAYARIHRARFVQPLPLVRDMATKPREQMRMERPFHILNTSMLTCATLNNNEVVALIERFLNSNPGLLLG